MSVSIVPSVLEAVTVYAQGALVTRAARVKAEGGRLPTRVRIPALPLSLRTGSLRAFVRKGPAGLIVRDVRAELDVERPPEVDVPAEQKALEAAQERWSAKQTELGRVVHRIQILKGLRPRFVKPKEGEAPRPAAVGALLELTDFVSQELEALQPLALSLEEEAKKLAEEVELRRRRINEASSANRTERTVVRRAAVLTLSDVAGAEDAELLLEYSVNAARWAPAYELNLSRAMDSGALELRANVIQRTGEDWTGAKLSLSTASLDRRAELHELKSLRIGRRQPPSARSGWREAPAGLDELFVDYERAPQPPAPPRPAIISAAHDDGERTRAGTFKGARSAPAMPMAPPPPPMPAAMPVSAAMPVAQAAAAPGGMPPPAPKAARPAAAPRARAAKKIAFLESEKSAAPELEESLEGGGGFGGLAPEPPSGVEPESSLLDYDALEVAGANQPNRGKLARPQVSRELIALAALDIQINVSALFAVVERHVYEVQSAKLPTYSVSPRDSAAYFDYRFALTAPVTVPSDGSWHVLPVFTANVALTPEYYAVPSVDPLVFRTVKLENRTPHALLAGPVDVRLGDEFLMTSPLPTLAPGQVERLGLGVEESIKVSRNTRFDESSGGVFGGSTVLTHGIEVEVANRLAWPVSVEVRDRVPTAMQGEKDIKVEELEVKPPWSKPERTAGQVPIEGERAWKVRLNPSETQKLSSTFVVRIPSSKMLEGGNRRV